MAATCARMLGAERIFMLDCNDYRLRFVVEAYGAVAINLDEQDDPGDVIIAGTARRGVDASIDTVGFEAKGSSVETTLTNLKLEGSSGAVLRQAIAATRRGGVVSRTS
jgi:threonine dehydrogenase-like Zn-dependent dehydrogenase